MPSTILSDNGVTSGTAGIKTTGSNDGQLVLQTTTAGGAATTAVTIDTGQRTTFPTTIAVGAATPSTSGSGITFPATQSASSDANTLDDYEEGTFTPIIGGSSSAGTGTYTTQRGSYTKVGRLVYCQVELNWTAHTGTGSMYVGGLPFNAIATNPNGYGGGFIVYAGAITLTANNYLNGLEMQPSNNIAYFYQSPVGGGGAAGVAVDTSAVVECMIIYQV